MNGVVSVVTVAGRQGGEGPAAKELIIIRAVTVVVRVFIKFGAAVVHDAVAVIVDAVAGFPRAGVDGYITVIAVTGQTGGEHPATNHLKIIGTITVTVRVLVVFWTAVIRNAVAVVVDPVADLRCRRVNGVVSVVTVAVHQDGEGSAAKELIIIGAITIAVIILVILDATVVHYAIAVIVYSVAGFSRAGVDGRITVVAVRVVGHVTANGKCLKNIGIAVAVSVEILVPEGATLIGHAIAIIVKTIAAFGRAGIDGRIAIVTVAGHRGGKNTAAKHLIITGTVTVAVRILVVLGTAVIRNAVAVIINAVTNLRCRGMNGVVSIVTVTGQVGGKGAPGKQLVTPGTVSVAVIILVVLGAAFVRNAVAVIINTVTGFRHAGMDGRVTVITITGHGGGKGPAADQLKIIGAVSVTVIILVVLGAAFVHDAVTVVINAITGFGGAGIDGRITVIAVRVIGHVPGRGKGLKNIRVAKAVAVAVKIPGGAAFVRNTVTVIVNTVTGFNGSWIDGRIAIITVAG